MTFSFISTLWIWIALFRQAASIILAQTSGATLGVEELVFLTGSCVVPDLILQSSFKASSEKLAILAHDSSLPSGDVCIKWIVFMCLFFSVDCRGLEWLTEVEMLKKCKAKMIMCVSYKPETSQMGVVGRLLSGRGISPSANFVFNFTKDVAAWLKSTVVLILFPQCELVISAQLCTVLCKQPHSLRVSFGYFVWHSVRPGITFWGPSRFCIPVGMLLSWRFCSPEGRSFVEEVHKGTGICSYPQVENASL